MTEDKPQNTITIGQKRASIGFGLVLVAFGLFALFSLLRESLPLIFSSPQQLTIAQAAEIATEDNSYVQLEDAVYLCDRLEYRMGRSSSTNSTDTRYTDIWLTDEANTVAVFASFSGRRDCEWIMERDLSGFLRTADTLPRTAGVPPFSLQGEMAYLELCAYCGRVNSIGVMIAMLLVTAFGGLSMFAGFARPVGPAPE
jgi:hypothetical protein